MKWGASLGLDLLELIREELGLALQNLSHVQPAIVLLHGKIPCDASAVLWRMLTSAACRWTWTSFPAPAVYVPTYSSTVRVELDIVSGPASTLILPSRGILAAREQAPYERLA